MNRFLRIASRIASRSSLLNGIEAAFDSARIYPPDMKSIGGGKYEGKIDENFTLQAWDTDPPKYALNNKEMPLPEAVKACKTKPKPKSTTPPISILNQSVPINPRKIVNTMYGKDVLNLTFDKIDKYDGTTHEYSNIVMMIEFVSGFPKAKKVMPGKRKIILHSDEHPEIITYQSTEDETYFDLYAQKAGNMTLLDMAEDALLKLSKQHRDVNSLSQVSVINGMLQ